MSFQFCIQSTTTIILCLRHFQVGFLPYCFIVWLMTVVTILNCILQIHRLMFVLHWKLSIWPISIHNIWIISLVRKSRSMVIGVAMTASTLTIVLRCYRDVAKCQTWLFLDHQSWVTSYSRTKCSALLLGLLGVAQTLSNPTVFWYCPGLCKFHTRVGVPRSSSAKDCCWYFINEMIWLSHHLIIFIFIFAQNTILNVIFLQWFLFEAPFNVFLRFGNANELVWFAFDKQLHKMDTNLREKRFGSDLETRSIFR